MYPLAICIEIPTCNKHTVCVIFFEWISPFQGIFQILKKSKIIFGDHKQFYTKLYPSIFILDHITKDFLFFVVDGSENKIRTRIFTSF